jgi:MFS family permease
MEPMSEITGISFPKINLAAMTIFNLFVAVSAILGGILLDKLGAIKVFIGGLVLIAIGALLAPAIGSSFNGLMFIRFLQGFGTGPIMAAAAPIAASYFPKDERSIVTGCQGFAVSFGIFIGAMIVPRISVAIESPFKALMVLAPIAVVGLILSLVVAFGPKVTQEEPTQADPGGQDPLAAQQFKKALAHPGLWIAIASFTLMSGIYQQMIAAYPNFIGGEKSGGLGFGEVAGGDAFSKAQILWMIGSIVSGFIAEKLLKGNPRFVIVIGFLLGAVFSFLIKYDFITSSYGVLVFVLCVTLFFCSWVNPQTQAYIAKNYPKNITGKLGGLGMGIGIFGGTGGSALVSLVLSNTDRYVSVINMMAGLCFLGFIISLFLTQRNE